MAQTINLGKIRLDWRGDFNPSTAYVANDVVTYRQGQWVCTQPTQASSFTGSQTGNTLTVTSLNPITPTTGTNIVSTAAGTTVTVASTQGLQTGNIFVVTGNAGGGLSAQTYFVGQVLSSTTLTLSISYAAAIANNYLTFTAYTFGSSSLSNPLSTGTSYVAYGSLAVGQIIAGSTAPLVITNATGTGSIATLAFASQSSSTPFASGSTIVVQGVTPLGYNGTFVVLNSTSTTVTFSNTTTAPLQPGSAGTITSISAVNTITAAAFGNGVGTYTVSNTLSSPSGSQSWTTIFSGSTPSSGSSYWTSFTQLFNNTSNWVNGQSYAVGDVVVYSVPTSLQNIPATIAGQYSLSRTVIQTFYCIQAHTASNTGTVITPADAGYWTPINRKGIVGSQLSPQSLYSTYQLGVYSNQNYTTLVLPNRGIAFDNSANYYNGSTKNTTDSPTFGYVTANGQVMNWGSDVNGSSGVPQAGQSTSGTSLFAENSLTFPFYDFWRSTSNSGTGVHATPDGGMPRVIQWEKSYDRNLVLTNSGEVFSWGQGGSGENGDGSTANRAYPVRVGGSVASVYNNTNPSGTVFTNGTRYTAGHSLFNVRIKRISMSGGCGYGTSNNHCLALDENGQVWVWGNNANGQLGMLAIEPGGTMNTTNQSLPQVLPKTAFATGANPGGQSVTGIWACGAGNQGWSYAVTQDGNLWAWGYNASGQLGTVNTTTYYGPHLVDSVTSVVGTYFGSGAIGSIVKIQVLDDASSTTYACAAILTSTGQIFVTGNNASGWAGSATGSFNFWQNIGGGPGTQGNSACLDFWLYGTGGRYATLMQRDKNTGYCWTAGYNLYGQLGYSGTGTSSSSTFTISKMNVGGSLYNLSNVKQLAFSSYGNICVATVVLDNGAGFSIGNNYFGAASTGYSSTTVGAGAAYSGNTNAYNVPALSGTAYNEPNGIELVNSYVWQPMRTPPGMQGNFADCMGFGYSDQTAQWLVWVNKDGRLMAAGKGQSVNNVSPFGQYRSGYQYYNSVNAETMTTPITD